MVVNEIKETPKKMLEKEHSKENVNPIMVDSKKIEKIIQGIQMARESDPLLAHEFDRIKADNPRDPLTSGVVPQEIPNPTFEETTGGAQPVVDTEVSGGISPEMAAFAKEEVENIAPNVQPEVIIENLEKIKAEKIQNMKDLHARDKQDLEMRQVAERQALEIRQEASLAELEDMFNAFDNATIELNDWKIENQANIDKQLNEILADKKTLGEATEMAKKANEAIQQSASPAPMQIPEPVIFPSMPVAPNEPVIPIPEPALVPYPTPMPPAQELENEGPKKVLINEEDAA